MNKEQLRGSTKSALGKLQRGAGKFVGSKRLQVRGLKKRVDGKVLRRVGDLKQAVKNSSKTRAR